MPKHPAHQHQLSSFKQKQNIIHSWQGPKDENQFCINV